MPPKRQAKAAALAAAEALAEAGRVGSKRVTRSSGGKGGAAAPACPVLSIPGRTFPIADFFLEDAIERSGFVARGKVASANCLSDRLSRLGAAEPRRGPRPRAPLRSMHLG